MLPSAAAFIFDLEDEEEEENQLHRRQLFQELRMERKLLRDASNPFTLDAEYFRKLYRLIFDNYRFQNNLNCFFLYNNFIEFKFIHCLFVDSLQK